MDIRSKLGYNLKGKVAIVGVGNAMRGDDGFGPVLTERLKGRVSASLINAGATPENHVKAIRESRPDAILVIDAADFGGNAGDIRLLERKDVPTYGLSTHNASLALFFDFLEADTKAKVYMLAVQPAKSDMNTPLSPALEKTCCEIETLLLEVLQSRSQLNQ
jgi:hydrogenase 3 maturation protease